MNKQITELNQILTDHITEQCRNKKHILLTLTGGMDSRLILSILLKQGIQPDVITWYKKPIDLDIARHISQDLKLNHIILYHPEEKGWSQTATHIIDSYDIVLYGELISEVFNKFVRWTESEKKLNQIIDNFFKYAKKHYKYQQGGNRCYPCMDTEVMKTIYKLPIYQRMYGYTNRHLIKINQPSLLKYPHTCVNLRYRLIEKLYWIFIPLL